MNARSSIPVCFVFVVWIALILACNAGKKEITAEQRNAIEKIFAYQNYPKPALELTNDGFLRATLELNEPRTAPELKKYGEDAVLALWNAANSFHLANRYEVILNGPSPGSGPIRRYGVARYDEGDQVKMKWEPAN